MAPVAAGDPSVPTTIELGQRSRSFVGRAMSTEHGASCSMCVATEPSAMPSARL